MTETTCAYNFGVCSEQYMLVGSHLGSQSETFGHAEIPRTTAVVRTSVLNLLERSQCA